jgi:hypothetical protein
MSKNRETTLVEFLNAWSIPWWIPFVHSYDDARIIKSMQKTMNISPPNLVGIFVADLGWLLLCNFYSSFMMLLDAYCNFCSL